MEGYEERQGSISVPGNTGVDGFLKTLRSILSLPKVQSISIDATGTVRYMRYVREGEPDGPLNLDYADMQPWNIIRGGDLQEVSAPDNTPAPVIIAGLFDIVAGEGLIPIAFATGAGSNFWRWHELTAGMKMVRKGAAYGLPIYTDRQMPDYSLVLCAAYVRSGLVDCHRFLLVHMPLGEFAIPETTVSVL
jgi:hypothetical protein